MDDAREDPDLISLTVEIVSAFVANNPIKSAEVASLIRETHDALGGLRSRAATEPATVAAFTPAVGIRKSLSSREHILSLIDGKPHKVLTRHLAKHGLTPTQYRQRYGLPPTYPMVAPAYSEMRSAAAKKIGLGQLARNARAGKASTSAAKPSGSKRRGRPRKATP